MATLLLRAKFVLKYLKVIMSLGMFKIFLDHVGLICTFLNVSVKSI